MSSCPQKLQINDRKFFPKIIMDLTNVHQMYMRPMLSDVLQARSKAHGLQTYLADQCVPMYLSINDNVATEKINSSIEVKQLKGALQLIDHVLFVEPLQESMLKDNNKE